MNKLKQVFTIGHSTHQLEYFIKLIKSQKINTLIDIRSMPASKYNPQYNKDSFEYFLQSKGIKYMHFGFEFGARHDDEDFLDDDGMVNFIKFRRSFQFQNGIERLDIGISNGYNIVLMCSEGDPLECHRFSMISVYLEEIGIVVKHIMKDGSMQLHKDLEQGLLEKYSKKLLTPDLFNPNVDTNDQLKQAYKLHNKDIGWHSENNHNEDLYK
jgi:uncharacterized protein (DUF488 family)